MAATTTTVLGTSATSVGGPPLSLRRRLPWPVLLPLLTLATLLIDGYHPLAEDGGLYVAGIEYRLNPTLFPRDTAFVTAHLHYSLFAPALAELTRIAHLPLAITLLLAYVFTLWLLLYAGLQLLRRCTPSPAAQLAGVALLAAWSTLPVAGTSLLLTDPYLTARSFTTPLSLLAIAFALDDWTPRSRSARLCALSLVLAALLHPLMAFCALAMVVLLRLFRSPHSPRLVASFAVVVLSVAATIHAFAPPDPPAVVAASLSRYYWFLSQWHWYELCGLLGPFAMLSLLLLGNRNTPRFAATSNIRALCLACLAAGSIAIAIALLFAHAHSTTYLIARLQPLRIFLLIYAIMALLLGALVTGSLLSTWRSRPIKAVATVFPAFAIMISSVTLFTAQRATFPASRHIELPSASPINPWSQAFLWVRANTPTQALFALDPDYITTPGEDAQTFRATALRSALPDFSKDGGEASITPSLAPLWQHQLTAQFAIQSGTALTTHAMLSAQTDAERDARLRPLGVTWLILHADARTAHPCPYQNRDVKVCRLAP
ncbi:hypothetical protein GOB94_13170 [Granulicella sp. 5B5]|uniref:hypothetical protein n=1 Tax=Granulicella sp. 5B5 TaxID=1617967 RepID=UPI0015F6C68E|nr:hypothetical protein [Granulicella sp. 5B5]QMV19529.1 hypothetical protein GOB94_13170 [Granulicella sp. 5B5]